MAVIRGSGFIQLLRPQLVIAQVEAARISFVELQLQRPVQMARPDEEIAIPVGHPDGIVGRHAIHETNRDALHLRITQRRGQEVFLFPALVSGHGLVQHIAQCRPFDGVAGAVQDRLARTQLPIAALRIRDLYGDVRHDGDLIEPDFDG